MNLFRSSLLFLLVASFATTGLAGKRQEDPPAKKPDAKDKAKDKDNSDDDDATPQKGKFNIGAMMVEGHPSHVVKIPYWDAQGKLSANYLIGEVEKIDADNAKLSDMKVETFDEKGAPDMSMDIPNSIFNLSSHILVSHTPVTISRHDFTISGDSVEFNVDTKEGTLVGHVHMSVYDLNAAADPTSDDAESQSKETQKNVKKP